MKKERRITITVQDGVSDATAFERLAKVAQGGQISIANKKKHYCFKTTWTDGIFVSSKMKYKTDSDRFYVGLDPDLVEVTCPECGKKLAILKEQRDLFSCGCGYYKIEKSILIKIKEHEKKT